MVSRVKVHVSFNEARNGTHALAFVSVGNAMLNRKFLV